MSRRWAAALEHAAPVATGLHLKREGGSESEPPSLSDCY
jgi:hypothetical protein